MATIAQQRGIQVQPGIAIHERVLGGIIGGLAGGVVFGVMMGAMGMLPMVAGLVGSSSAITGFWVHIAISASIGALYGLAFGGLSTNYAKGLGLGLAYGAIWWVLGPLTLMPLMMGMGVQFANALATPMLMSLVGHLLFGLFNGLAYAYYADVRR